jgi:hypothetical protein
MIKIIAIFDKHEDFIKLQYDSIIKHVKGDYEYIIFNNAANEEQANLNKNTCDELGIKCVRITVNYSKDPSNVAGEALNASFKTCINDKVFKIDSDMFFISDININELFDKHDLIYVPTYQINREIMWSGVFGIDMSKIDINLDFRPGVVQHTDTFGQSCLLTVKPNLNKKLCNLYNLQNTNNGVYTTSLNGDCLVHIADKKITFVERPEFYNIETLGDLVTIYDNMVTSFKKHEFPEPYNLDMIDIDGINTIIHFKSANWCPWYTEDYVNNKKEALKRFLNSF